MVFKILNKKYLLLIVSFSLFFAIGSSEAAILYLDPSEGPYFQEDIFIVEVKIDNEKECINAVEVNLTFPDEVLELIDFSETDSILSIWLRKPEVVEKGLISFAGGIPGGFCGKLLGDPGDVNLITKLIFLVKNNKSNLANIDFKDSQVLLNDSLGTKANLTFKGASFSIFPGTDEISINEWNEIKKNDFFPPEPFNIEISQNFLIFDNQHFIIFYAKDKQTGIDYYEIKEGSNDWKKAESPYLLEDQDLQSIIIVKAVDRAGNEMVAEYYPILGKSYPLFIVIPFIVILIWLIYIRFFRKK
ncbi:MAG: cohesin domain-containing protein [Patescibacteria group bacterium]